MKKIDIDLLEKLNNDDIKIIISETKLDMMLAPFKQNSKTYAKYISRLGRLDTKSKMVNANLPGIVYELYNRRDLNIRKLMSIQAQNIRQQIIAVLAEYKTEKLTPESFSGMDSTRCVEVLLDIENKDTNNGVNINLFFLQLKLNAVEIPEQKRNEIKELWGKQKEKEAVEKKRKQELDEALKIVEDSCKNEIELLRNEYRTKINATELAIRSLEAKTKKQQVDFNDLEDKIEAQKKEMFDISKALSGLCEKIENQRREFEHILMRGDETHNKELIRIREQLIDENQSLQTQIDFLLDDRHKAEEELKQIKESISATEVQLAILKNDIDNYSIECRNVSPCVSQGSTSEQNGGLRLFTEPGTTVIQKEVCEKYSQYVMAVETNLDIIGYKMSSNRSETALEDFFNAAVDIGLVPLLFGFGARKAAMALIAARYGEIPTIISVPAGYNNVVALSREIDKAETAVVIIEDLFGRMNEEMILPVLRSDIDKQLVFCAESSECLKYTAPYFMNYIQLIKVDITSHKKMAELVFVDAKELFAGYRHSEKSEMHKKVKKLLREINISDIYIQSRGDMLTYLDEVAQHNIDTIFEDWLEHELLNILKPEQKKIIRERLAKDSLGVSVELIEKFDE